MGIENRIRERLASLQPRSLHIVDDSAAHAGHAGARDGGGHYQVSIVSPLFAGKSMLARHRMVYAALGELMQREIHALTIEATAGGDGSSAGGDSLSADGGWLSAEGDSLSAAGDISSAEDEKN